MKVSKLIEDLQKLQAEHGDLEVTLIDSTTEDVFVLTATRVTFSPGAEYWDRLDCVWQRKPAIVIN